MTFHNYKFHERTRTTYPCGQVIARGMMDMGGYDEAAMVVIAEGMAVAYVEDEVIVQNVGNGRQVPTIWNGEKLDAK